MNRLDLPPPPERKTEQAARPKAKRSPKAKASNDSTRSKGKGIKFEQIAEAETVQFNRRISRGTADGYEMLAIRTRTKVPELLAEGLALLEEKYGKI